MLIYKNQTEKTYDHYLNKYSVIIMEFENEIIFVPF